MKYSSTHLPLFLLLCFVANVDKAASFRVLLLSAIKKFTPHPRWQLFANMSQPTDERIKATVQIALSVDGFIADPDGGVGFLERFPTPEGEDFGFNDFLKSIDVIIMGHNSFDKVVSFGKEMYAYGDIKVVVWTRDPTKVEVPDHLEHLVSCSSLKPSDLLMELQEKGSHRHAYVDGGITVQKFLEANCIDSLILTRVPILLGCGIPLFGNNPSQESMVLKLVDNVSYANGFITTTYDVLDEADDDDDDDDGQQE